MLGLSIYMIVTSIQEGEYIILFLGVILLLITVTIIAYPMHESHQKDIAELSTEQVAVKVVKSCLKKH